MHYKELLAGVNAYYYAGKKNGENFPKKIHKDSGKELKYYDALDEKKPRFERIKIFVNKWGKSRVHIDDAKLKKNLKIFQEKYEKMLQWDIIQFTQTSLWTNHDEIVELFKLFAEVLKYTGTSKALHILNQDFFMMWDGDIRQKGYGCFGGSGEGYFNFLLRSQKEIEEVCKTYIKDYGNVNDPSKEIPQKIYSVYNGHSKTIVKLLDEYNFARYKKGWI